MRVVVDTNILVSALLTPSGNSARVLELALRGDITVQYDQRIVNEYRVVLSREKFGFRKGDIESLLDFIENDGEACLGEITSHPFTDESDRKFWEIMLAPKAEALVTGNAAHYPQDRRVMASRAFLDWYLGERGS